MAHAPVIPNGAPDALELSLAPEREASEDSRHLESAPHSLSPSPSLALALALPLQLATSPSSLDQAPVQLNTSSADPIRSCATTAATIDSSLPAAAECSHSAAPLLETSAKSSTNPPLRPTSLNRAIAASQQVSQSICERPADKSTLKPNDSRTNNTAAPKLGSEVNMLFSQSAGPGHRRRTSSGPSISYDPDLTSRDRAKQKTAVKRFMAERIRSDWKWQWPVSDPQAAVNVYATPGVPPGHDRWKERDEWESDIESEVADSTKVAEAGRPFRFESPDGVVDAIKGSVLDHKRHRQKGLKDEMSWNEGLRCFVLRRDAWTGARKFQHTTNTSSSSKRQKLGASSSNSSSSKSASPSPTSAPAQASIADSVEASDDWETDVEVPIPDPILPLDNYMRQTITPATYNTIYDKVILQQLTPACPLNLVDVTRSCVQGWKRDGEWPAKGSVPDQPSEAARKKSRKMSVASLFGLERLSSKENGEAAAARENERDHQKEVERGRPDTQRKGSFLEAPAGQIRRGFQRLLSLGKDGKSKDGRRGSKESVEVNGKETRDVTDINLA